MSPPTLAHKSKPLDHSKSVERAKAAGAVTFTDFAVFKLKELYDNPEGFIGRKHADVQDYALSKRTDCITYVISCLKDGFAGINDENARKKVGRLAGNGAAIQKYLVNSHNWTGIYYAQDSQNLPPYSNNASRKCSYWGVKTDYILADYQKDVIKTEGVEPTEAEKRGLKGMVDLQALAKVKFAFGISNSGTHTWLLSEGKVYEVHWSAQGQAGVYGSSGLYEARLLRKFTSGNWSHGSIVVPKGHAPTVSSLSKMSCAN